jgi:pimeloyl-ACP methyl ester carboxylesterase
MRNMAVWLRGGLATVVVVGGIAATAASQAAQAAPPPPTSGQGYAKISQFVTSRPVPGRPGAASDGTIQIDTDLYIPSDATPATPQPAVIYANGFGGAKDDASGSTIGPWLASHGYVVLAYSSSGFGNSGGCIELDSPQYDAQDVSALIDVLATKPYVYRDGPGDPRVAMIGGSYGGAIQLMAAASDPRLDVIAPFRTWDDLQYALSPQHLGGGSPLQAPGADVGVIKHLWTTLFFASGISQPLQQRGGCGPSTGATCPGFDPQACQVYVNAEASGRLDSQGVAVLQNSSPSRLLGRITIPTLLGQGQADTLFNLDESVATYLSLRGRGVPTRLIWQWGGHGYSPMPGEGDLFNGAVANPDSEYLPQQILLWYDRWLRQDTSVDTGPPVTYFRDWVPYDPTGSAAPAYGHAHDMPFEPPETFSLSGGDQLVPPGSTPSAGAATLVNPLNSGQCASVPQLTIDPTCSFTEFSNYQQPGATLPGGAPSPYPGTPPSDPPGTFVTFTSPPFAADTMTVGIPTAHLQLSHTNAAQDVVLYGKLYDVAPDGSAQLIHRLIAPFRVAATPTSQAVNVYLDGIAHLFPAGHHVRLELAATDDTSINNREPDVITVTTGGPGPSTFTLPVGSANAH